MTILQSQAKLNITITSPKCYALRQNLSVPLLAFNYEKLQQDVPNLAMNLLQPGFNYGQELNLIFPVGLQSAPSGLIFQHDPMEYLLSTRCL